MQNTAMPRFTSACLRVAIIGLGFSNAALAAQGEVCTSRPAPAGISVNPVAMAAYDSELTNDVKFDCKSVTGLTIPQLYEKGWRVTAAMPTMVVSAEARAVFEKARAAPGRAIDTPPSAMRPQTAWKLIVERP